MTPTSTSNADSATYSPQIVINRLEEGDVNTLPVDLGDFPATAVESAILDANRSIAQIDDIEERFLKLATEWKLTAGAFVNPTHRSRLPQFQKLLQMGENIVPLVIGELDSDYPSIWFGLLIELTGKNPAAGLETKTTENTARAWIEWAKRSLQLRHPYTSDCGRSSPQLTQMTT